MGYTKGEWKAYCLGSEGYQVSRNNEGIPAAKGKEELKERLTPIVERMGGSFETQKANAYLIAAAPEMVKLLEVIVNEAPWKIDPEWQKMAKEILATIP